MTLNAGAELRLTDRLSVFAEGRLFTSFTTGVGFSAHAGVSFRFGRWGRRHLQQTATGIPAVLNRYLARTPSY